MASPLGHSSVSISLTGPSFSMSSGDSPPHQRLCLLLYLAYPSQMLVPGFDNYFSGDLEHTPTAPAVRLKAGSQYVDWPHGMTIFAKTSLIAMNRAASDCGDRESSILAPLQIVGIERVLF